MKLHRKSNQQKYMLSFYLKQMPSASLLPLKWRMWFARSFWCHCGVNFVEVPVRDVQGGEKCQGGGSKKFTAHAFTASQLPYWPHLTPIGSNSLMLHFSTKPCGVLTCVHSFITSIAKINKHKIISYADCCRILQSPSISTFFKNNLFHKLL